MLYSQAEEVASACQKDKELNGRIYCVLGMDELPEKPDLSDICDSPPSNYYQFVLFYDCVPCEPVAYLVPDMPRSCSTLFTAGSNWLLKFQFLYVNPKPKPYT